VTKILAVVFALLSVVLGVVAIQASSSKQADEDRAAAVRRTAGAMGSALLTYNYKDLDKTKTQVLAVATGTFRKQYQQAFTGGLDTILTNTKAVSSVRDIEIFLSDVTDETATAIVVVDTRVSGTAGEGRSLTSYLRLELVHAKSKWLVDGVTNLNLGLPESNTPAGGSTTPTTANASTTTR
jgi:Mce-associated membrane protein